MRETDERTALRVLWLIKGLGPGGAEKLLVTLAKVKDPSIAVEAAYLLPWKDTLVGDLEDEGVATHCLGVNSVADVRWLWRLRRLMRQRRFDILHLHSPAVAAPARLAARLTVGHNRPRIVYTEHNVWSSYGWPTRAANAFTYLLDDAHVGVSEEVRRSVPRPFRRELETVVHGIRNDEIVDAVRAAPATRAALGVGDDVVLVCTVANLRREKAYPDLLAAAKRVLDRDLPVQFVAVGQGPLEAELKDLHAQMGLGDRFRFLGFREDAIAITAASDIFALPSRYEGFPIAIMEALAVGAPVVATAVGGVPEAVEPGVDGLIVPAGHPDAFADALTELITNDQRRTTMSTGAARHIRAYDIGSAAQKYEQLYASLARRDVKPVGPAT